MVKPEKLSRKNPLLKLEKGKWHDISVDLSTMDVEQTGKEEWQTTLSCMFDLENGKGFERIELPFMFREDFEEAVDEAYGDDDEQTVIVQYKWDSYKEEGKLLKKAAFRVQEG